jgi:hypothetical protein
MEAVAVLDWRASIALEVVKRVLRNIVYVCE